MTIDEMKIKLEKVLTEKRFVHSVNVMNTAIELANRYKEDMEKAALAGLLHDCAKYIRGQEALDFCYKYNIKIDSVTRLQPELLHGPIGAELARIEYGITDKAILKAIYCHTTGCESMSMLDKIIFLADFIEPGRSFPGVDNLRSLSFSNIDEAMILAIDTTIKRIIDKGLYLHADAINARNSIIFENRH